MADPNPVTTHVLNTANGQPAAGLRLSLSRRAADGSWEALGTHETNADGRLSSQLLAQGAIKQGDVFQLHFETGAYFAAKGQKCFYPHVDIAFEIDDPASHYHVPLLLSPFGSMTYRGS